MSNFSDETIQAVWNKGRVVSGRNAILVRKDIFGSLMSRSEYGNTNSKYGWEIDHIRPVSRNGSDNLSNLQPLQWENNRRKGDNYPFF